MLDRDRSRASPKPGDTVPPSDATGWRFEGFEFDPRRGELSSRDGRPVPLRAKVESLLRLFLAEPGRLFGKDELIAALWPDAVVTDDSLVQCVGELRSALGDRAQTMIRTVPRRGYRWQAAVEPIEAAKTAESRDPAAIPRLAGASRRPSRRTGVLVLLAVALACGVVAAGRWTRPSVHIDQEVAALNTVVVMPFASLSNDDELRRLGEQVGDEVIEQVSMRIGMRAIGRGLPPAADGGRDPGQAADPLRATKLVTGRVADASAPDRFAVDLQLSESRNGAVLWSHHFERDRAGTRPGRFDIGAQVANAVRNASVKTLDVLLESRVRVPEPVVSTLRGWNDLDRFKSADDVKRARGRFEEALRADPESIIALNGLAATYVIEGGDPRAPLTSAQKETRDLVVERMRRLAPDDPTCLLVWASVELARGRADLALPAIDKANRLSPSYANGHVLRAQALLLLGRTEEVQAEAERALELDENHRWAGKAYGLAAEAALMLGQPERAAALANRSIVELPNNVYATGTLAAANAVMGHSDAAASDLRRMLSMWPEASVALFDRARPSLQPTYLAQRSRLYEGLRKAGLPA